MRPWAGSRHSICSSVSARRHGVHPAQPGVGSGYHLRPDGPGLPLTWDTLKLNPLNVVLRVGKDPEVIVAPQLAVRVHEPRSEYIKDAEDRKLAFVWYALSSTRDSSLNQSYPNQVWKDKARTAIRGCDAVVVLVGQDTHNAQGVIVETDMARSLNNSLGVSGEIIAQAGGGPAEGVDSLQVLLSIV